MKACTTDGLHAFPTGTPLQDSKDLKWETQGVALGYGWEGAIGALEELKASRRSSYFAFRVSAVP